MKKMLKKLQILKGIQVIQIDTPSLEPLGFNPKYAWKNLRKFPIHASVANYAWKCMLQQLPVSYAGTLTRCIWCSTKVKDVQESNYHQLVECVTTRIAKRWAHIDSGHR